MYETVFNSIDDTLRTDAGCSSELDYVEQTSWVLFLKYLEDYDAEKKSRADIDGIKHTPILKEKYRWSTWAVPRKENGEIDHNRIMVGKDLLEFVDDLFKYLKKFIDKTDNPRSLEYKIGEIFSEVRNKIQSGYALRDVIDKVDRLQFRTGREKYEFSLLYEDKIKNMGNAGRNGGEYYTPRPLIQAMVEIINPKINQTVYDGAVGSAGFLCEAFEWIYYGGASGSDKKKSALTAKQTKVLQEKTFYGNEVKSLAYVIGVMNMILHGIEAPNIVHADTLEEYVATKNQEVRKYDVILANPPFGASVRKDIQNSFPIPTGETSYLFLQHFIKVLKKGGSAGVVIKSSFLNNADKASIALRKQLLEDCNLFAILDLPSGAFFGTGTSAVVLFFEKGKGATEEILYCQLDEKRKVTKKEPLTENDLAEFVDLLKEPNESKKRKRIQESRNSWVLNIKTILEERKNYDLSAKNLKRIAEIDPRTPKQIFKEIKKLNDQADKAFKIIKELL